MTFSPPPRGQNALSSSNLPARRALPNTLPLSCTRRAELAAVSRVGLGYPGPICPARAQSCSRASRIDLGHHVRRCVCSNGLLDSGRLFFISGCRYLAFSDCQVDCLPISNTVRSSPTRFAGRAAAAVPGRQRKAGRDLLTAPSRAWSKAMWKSWRAGGSLPRILSVAATLISRLSKADEARPRRPNRLSNTLPLSCTRRAELAASTR